MFILLRWQCLDIILTDKGYKEGSLGKKIHRLKRDLKNGCEILWMKESDIDRLFKIDKIGTYFAHTGNRVNWQKEINDELVVFLKVFFMLLYKIYDKDKNELNKLHELSKKINVLKNYDYLLVDNVCYLVINRDSTID